MKNPFHSFLLAFLLTAGTAAAQTPAVSLLHPAQTIALSPNNALAGTVQLPNHNTVLLLTDTESPVVRILCLRPDGQTAWEKNIERYQLPTYIGFPVFTQVVFWPIAETIFLRKAIESSQQMRQHSLVQLVDLQVVSTGNVIYTVERLTKAGVKNQLKGAFPPLTEGQVVVNRLDEQGQQARVVFAPGPDPADRKVKSEILGRYADGNGYVEVIRETTQREESTSFFLDHYDFNTKTIRRDALPLPVTPERIGSGPFKDWYQDWVFLGHRPNQNYFCRRTLADNPADQPGGRPLVYRVYIADDNGRATPTGFSTTLELPAGTVPRSSGTLLSPGEIEHVPRFKHYTTTHMQYSVDDWDASNGNIGSFYLDHATGEVVIFGEYSKGDLPSTDEHPSMLGYFQHCYSPSGQLTSQVQLPYSKSLRASGKEELFEGGALNNNGRGGRFHIDPLTQQSLITFWMKPLFGSGDLVNLTLDQHLTLESTEVLHKIHDSGHLFTTVLYAEPHWLHKNGLPGHDYRLYETAAPADPPVYAALAQLRRLAGTQYPYHEFHFNATGPGTGLVVERKQAVGGSLQVFTF